MNTNKWLWIRARIEYLEKLAEEEGSYGALAYAEIKDEYFNEFGADLTADIAEYYTEEWKKK